MNFERTVRKARRAMFGYRHFMYREQRRLLPEVTADLSRFIEEHMIENLVLIDRRARPAATALNAYWKERPIDERPAIYFLNPIGCITAEYGEENSEYRDMTNHHVNHQLMNSMMGAVEADPILPPEPVRGRHRKNVPTDREAIKALRAASPFLMADPEKRTLVFDTCVHTGASFIAVRRLLEKAGFKNIFSLAGSKHSDSEAPPDIACTQICDHGSACFCFGTETLVRKQLFNPVSVRTDANAVPRGNAKLRMGRGVRREIKEIIGDSFSDR